MNPNYTQMPKKEFKEKMFTTALSIKEMMLSTSGCEEGMNVLLTILASLACSISDNNWEPLMKTANSGVVDDDEQRIGEISTNLFLALDDLRNSSFENKDKSKYIKRYEDVENAVKAQTFMFSTPDLPS